MAYSAAESLPPHRAPWPVSRGTVRHTPIVLLFLAIVPALCAGCGAESRTEHGEPLYSRDLSGGLHNTAPPRGETRELALLRDGDAFSCSICHDGFSEDSGSAPLEGEHQDIRFDHGLNVRCLNCHNAENSDTFVDHDGSEIPGSEPTRLCAKCHGPHYREWILGVHGRINGYWDERFGEQRRLDCIQCHNPHAPAFAPMRPVPPPVLTRFEDASRGDESHAE